MLNEERKTIMYFCVVIIRARFTKEVKSLKSRLDKNKNVDKENEHFKWTRNGNLPENCSFKGIDGALRSRSQLYIKRMSSLSPIFNRFVTFTLCIQIALRSEGDSMLQIESKIVPQGDQGYKWNSLALAPVCLLLLSDPCSQARLCPTAQDQTRF